MVSMPLIEALPWDSGFFHLRIGRSIIQSPEQVDYYEFFREAEKDYDLVYIVSPQKMLSYKTTLKSEIELVDVMFTMSMQFCSDSYCFGEIGDIRRSLSDEERKECYKIAEQVATVSRFYKEPMIGPENAKALYRKWVDNALNKSFCDGIIIYKHEGAVGGIHIVKSDLKEKIGYCSMIGIKKNINNFGIGKKLFREAFKYWSSNYGISQCRVVFSLNNWRAFNFYLSIGFSKLDELRYIYHYRNRGARDSF